MPTKIEWATETWNPVTGCSKTSPGCDNCYAERMPKRLAGRCGYPAVPNSFDVTLHPNRLEQPLKWKPSRRVFVCSMGDLFHEDVPFKYITEIFSVMARCPHHVFQVLTKRPARALEWFGYPSDFNLEPLPNIWFGVTTEDQQRADERVPLLLQIPAAVRFVSAEPMLGPVDMRPLHDHWSEGSGRLVDWVICGAETGPGTRPMDLEWARNLRDQCASAGVPFFFKKDSSGGRTIDGDTHEACPVLK